MQQSAAVDSASRHPPAPPLSPRNPPTLSPDPSPKEKETKVNVQRARRFPSSAEASGLWRVDPLKLSCVPQNPPIPFSSGGFTPPLTLVGKPIQALFVM